MVADAYCKEFLSLIDRMVEQIIPEPGAEEMG